MPRHSKHRGLPTAVIDTTLLSRLVALEVAHLLPFLFRRILIPPEVKHEAYKAPHRGKRRLIKLIREMSGYIVDCQEEDEIVKNILKVDLDAGEAAVIAQAEHTRSVVLLDEKRGFDRAVTMRLHTIRTARILIMLKQAGAIERAEPYFKKLESSGFYIKAETRRQLLAEVGEQ